ncbi:peptidoglycan DD-metalloendopeptidase family protein [Nocardia terpenica]|nr:peptidoglycan DD-metalloendopeptidase family protein [Nocardia terpenica]
MGIDFAAQDGTPVYAAQAGTVQYIGAASGFGQWIVLDHSDEQGSGTTVYGHMWDAFATGLSAGDHVAAGQLIAYVGMNGESTGPHLHFEVHPSVWAAGSQIDPEPWLQGSLYPGEDSSSNPPPASNRSQDTGAAGTTWFGIDIASWQAGLDMGLVAADGISYVIAKATQGTDYQSPEYPAQKQGARANGLLWMAYHYVEPGDAAGQVENFSRVEPDRSVPVMLDHEIGSGDAGDLRAVHDAFVAAGYRVALVYVPRWYWEGHIGSPDLSGLPPLMSSNYPSTDTAPVSALYPGDDHTGWNGYGGGNVAVYQFAETARIAGMTVDANAFKGTQAQLNTLFGTAEEDDMPYTRDDLKAIMFECLETFVGPIGKDVKDLRENALGARDDVDGTPGKECGGGRPLYELLAAVAARTGVPDTKDGKDRP